jgi:hypothetical protein
MSSINLQESQLSGCEKYIAIVVDESGSINANEAQQIREGLTSFINSQSQSNITLSLIGMSNSDNAVRTDNVIQKKVSGNHQEFSDWINSFGANRVSTQSDYWASGLNVASALAIAPDIVFLVTDGIQVNNSELLKGLFTDLNQRSRVFVYGVTSTADNVSELTTPLTTFLGNTPVVKNGSLSALDADYIRVPDFSTLRDELNQLTIALSTAQTGCIPNVRVIENKLVYPALKKGARIRKSAGTLVFRNKSRVALTLNAGTKIHSKSDLNGLIFTIQDTITIPGSSVSEAAIRVEGKPVNIGPFSAPIALNSVKNPLDLSINFSIGNGTAVVDISPEKTSLQSTYLQIAAAGSRGVDSTKGIHLRWMLAGKLGDKHLPKGDLYTGEKLGHNKPDDYVKVYRAPYIKVSHTLNLHEPPSVVDNLKGLWIYKTNNATRSIYVSFQNIEKYALVKRTTDPLTDPAAFIKAYGNNLIKIENKTELFFAAELDFTSVTTSSIVRLETLSVAENTFTAAKRVSNRQTYSSAQLNPIRLLAENGRSIQFKANNCLLGKVTFEFYSDFISHVNNNGKWYLKGKYGLSKNDTQVFEQLEPKLNAVHGKWLKYNNGECVNIANYKDKWNKPTANKEDRNILQIVESYILKSIDPKNPTAKETIPFGDKVPINDPKEGEEQLYAENLTDVHHLDLLNIAANDYHVARMLGLGCIDIDDEVLSGDFVYLTAYTTFGDLEDGKGAREVEHLSMSLPTAVTTERLPLPVQLSKIVPGLNVSSDEKQTAKITDSEGYSFDGKKRFISIFMDDVSDYDAVIDTTDETKTEFFKSSLEYDGSSFTFPIYLGVNHKIVDPKKAAESDKIWIKPELSSDLEYYNINTIREEPSFEPVPIIIPESGKSVLNIRQEMVGDKKYIYQGYGINIFSRASAGREINIRSHIKAANNLMPPTGINSLLITKESPLMFTSQSEQERLGKLPSTPDSDNTLVRIMFDYYSSQELVNYTAPQGMSVEEAKDPETIYPDSDEVFADHFRLYYKDGLPEAEYGKIDSIEDSPTDNLTSIIKIKEYKILSSGEEIKITLTEGNKNRFIGGILTIADQNYIVNNITVVNKSKKVSGDPDEFDHAIITVLKKEVSESAHAGGEATIDSEQIKAIKMPENRLCALVQNMQTASNWYKPDPLNFKVEIPARFNFIHREVIEQKNQKTTDLQVEKTRGIWENAIIERLVEDAYEKDEKGIYILDENKNPKKLSEKKHLGLYKITFCNFNLPQHPQFKTEGENSVEWTNGIVRLFTKNAIEEGNPVRVKTRKEFKVVRTENIGTTGDLILYINDTDFKLENYVTQNMHPKYDEIIGAIDEIINKDPNVTADEHRKAKCLKTPVSQLVNYYPSYKVYLYASPSDGVTKANIQPRKDESTRYSIFGISTHAVRPTFEYKSKISIPSPMYAVKIEEPIKPEKVTAGSLYATRPDFYNRSTFTFTTQYTKDRKPYAALHYRTNEEAIFDVLYERTTIDTIREELKKLGGNEEINFNKRWKNFLDFNALALAANYESFPAENESEISYRFPLPDNKEFIKLINDFIKWHNETKKPVIKAETIESLTALNKILIPKDQVLKDDLLAIHFIEEAIQSTFVPLTEVPVVYEHIKDNSYVPTNKKQKIKDNNGNALKATDTAFDIAPMMKIVDPVNNITQFTDFNLDGNSQNIYFYAVREMDIKMNFSKFSDIVGPVKLVASNPPQTPEIKRIMPVLENPILGIKPAIQIELNAYQPEYKIRKINIYRATSMQEAQSIRTMKLAKEVLINENTLSNAFDNVWTVYDEFEDLEFVPFGDGLFYRITVSREIDYEAPNSTIENPIITIDYTPSQPSKITATVVTDNVSPQSPVLKATANTTGANGEILKSVVFNWEKTVHNGKYHLYKMNNQGNWEKIQEKAANDTTVTLPLKTKQATDELRIKNENGERIYHHFKMLSENSSGMYSYEEKILTL